MQVKNIAESAILLTFIKLQFVFKMFILSIFARPFYTGFTVVHVSLERSNVSVEFKSDVQACLHLNWH